MPRRDGNGPMGNGPMTGRGFGPCNTNQATYGRPFRRNMGRGYANYRNPLNKEELQEEKDILKQRLEDIEKELKN